MKFKFDGVGKILSKIRIFKRKFDRTQDVEMRSRSWSPMKVGQPRSYYICQTLHIGRLTEEDKKYQTIKKDQTHTKFSHLFWRWYGQRRFRGWDQWESKSTKSLSKIEAEGDHRKAKKLLWYRNICRSHLKKYSWINTKQNYNKY